MASTDALQRSTTYAHDDADRLTSVSSGTAATTASFTYDTDGRRATMADRRTGLRYPNGQTVETAYDVAGRATAIEDWLGNTTELDYDADSNLVETAFPTTTPTSDTATYDEAGQLTEVELGSTASTPASLTYSYNQAGEQASVTSAGLPGPGSADFIYDASGRLTEGGLLDFAYDAADNPTALGATSQLSYDDAGQLETSTGSGGQTTYDFSAAGERTSMTPPSGPATAYGYDAAGQLSSVIRSGSPTVTYGYDGDGLRTDRSVGSTDTKFVWDKTGDLPLLLTEDGTSYIYGPDGLPLQSIDSSSTVRFFHHDRLGSTRQVTDEAGDVVAAQSYDAYGNITDTTGTARIPFGFAGEYWDDHTSLLYLRARHYDPATGQFVTRDPLETVSWQPYLYAAGDPVNRLDPDGLWPRGLSIPSPGQLVNGIRRGLGDGASTVVSGLDAATPHVSKWMGRAAGALSGLSAGCTVITLGTAAPVCATLATGAMVAGGVATAADAYLLIRGKQSAFPLVFSALGFMSGSMGKELAMRMKDEVARLWGKTGADIMAMFGMAMSEGESAVALANAYEC